MRRFLLIALTLGVSSSAFATSFAGFTGGQGDGYAHEEFIVPRQASAVIHFLGGGRDGYNSSSWRTYQPAALPAQARFAGNNCDGYASARFISVVQQSRLKHFSGGSFDGYAGSTRLSPWQQTQPRRFLGGSYDGYSRSAASGLPNWAVGDTDGNGLPDWWELKYFGILTGTPPQGEADRDGVSNMNEYLAGTNPTNAHSYFHIAGLTPGSPTKILVTCEPGKFYTLQRANDLALGWTAVTNQTRISSASEGILEMDDFFSDTSGFYRVLLEP